MQERRTALLCGHETKQLKQLEVKSKKMEWEESRGRVRARAHTRSPGLFVYICKNQNGEYSFMEMCVFPSNVVFFQQAKGGLRWKPVLCSGAGLGC